MLAGPRWRALAFALAASLFGTCAFALTFPALTGRVVDDANILDGATRQSLTQKLEDLESKTTTQLVVVTLNSLQGTSIEDYGYQLGRAWKIGQQGVNNGALLIVAPNERKVRIEVGYGLEGTLTDAVSKLIIENGILPRFRAGDFPGGITRGVDDLVQVLSGGAEEFKQRAGPAARSPGPVVSVLEWLLSSELGLFIVIIIIVMAINGVHTLLMWMGLAQQRPSASARRGRSPWIVPIPSGSSWSSGGSSWGSGGGGFSGGGGSFGGGGSSGSW
jgi:uncharacterized protein